MRDNQEDSASAHRSDWRALALILAAAVALAVFAATGSSHAAGLGKRGRSGTSGGNPKAHRARADDATALLGAWAACERAHGDSNQADPTVTHEVIYIAVRIGDSAVRIGSLPSGGSKDACSGYLAAAQRAVAGGQPVDGWGDDAKYVQYAKCMRANGYPTFPYPSGVEPDGHLRTNFNGTGVDPLSPAFLNGNANQICGKQIGAPAWWINSWGPPGSVDIYPAGASPDSPLPIGPPPGAPKRLLHPGANRGLAGQVPNPAMPSLASG